MLRLVIGVLVCTLIVLLSDINYDQIIGDIDYIYFFLGIICSWLISCLTSLRWMIISDSLAGRKVADFDEFLYTNLISRATGFITAKTIGELGVKGYWLKKTKSLSIKTTSHSILLDKLYDSMISGIFLLVVLPFWIGLLEREPIINFTLALILALLLIGSRFGAGINQLLSTVWNFALSAGSKRFFSKYHPETILASRVIPTPGFQYLFLITMVKFLLVVGRIICAALFVGAAIDWQLLILATPLGQAVALISITPGGLGILEAGWYGILVSSGVSSSDIIGFLIGQRIMLIVGLISLLPLVMFFLKPRSENSF